MADVFISYKRDERQAVERVAAKLRELGLNIWFDASVSAGETFNAEIDREARAAKAILVCWSPTARESRWVIAEAMIGFEQDKLAACHVAGPDGFSPPTPFNTSHAEDLRAWLAAPSETHAGWKSVLRRIGKLCGRSDIESWGALDAQASAAELRGWIHSHERSPLFMPVEAMLRIRETQDAERARLEKDARERQAGEEGDRRAREETERKGREEAQRRARLDREARERQALDEGLMAGRETSAKKKSGMTIWIVAVVIAAVGGGGYFFWQQEQAQELQQSAQAASTAWDAVDRNDPAALRAFISIESSGPHKTLAQDALRALEERSYEAARHSDTEEALQEFLRNFPDSDHALAARGRIAELRARQ